MKPSDLARAVTLLTISTALLDAQCYRFASGSDATLDLNLTSVPKPTANQVPGGMTDYQFDLSKLSGNTVTLTIRGKTATVDTFDHFLIRISTTAESTQVLISAGGSTSGAQTKLNAAMQLFNEEKKLFTGDSLPKSFPKPSSWTGKMFQSASLLSSAPSIVAMLQQTDLDMIGTCPSTER